MTSDPGGLAVLERRISAYARETQQSAGPVRVTVAQVVVAQALPSALVKGGSGMKFRLGTKFTRGSKDLDVAWREEQEEFATQMRSALESGWGPFRGQLVAKSQRPHPGVPDSYIMQPYVVRLTAYRKSFATVVLEVGYDDLGATTDGSGETILSSDITAMFTALGLPEPTPVAILAVHHQIAQKIHACTEPGSERAHDLVDLQLLWPTEDSDKELVAQTTRRLFAFRRGHVFPGKCRVGPTWSSAYSEAARGLAVEADVHVAAEWLNGRLAEMAI